MASLERSMPALYDHVQALRMHYERFHAAAVHGFAEAAVEMNALLLRAADPSRPLAETLGMCARCVEIGTAMRTALNDVYNAAQTRGAPKETLADLRWMYAEVVLLCRGCLSNVNRDIQVRRESARSVLLRGGGAKLA